MESVKYHFSYMFFYSERPNTFAQRKLLDNVPEKIKKRRLQEILRAVRQVPEARDPRRLHKQDEGRRAPAFPHFEVWGRADQPKGVCGPHEGGPERCVLHHRREHRASLCLPIH